MADEIDRLAIQMWQEDIDTDSGNDYDADLPTAAAYDYEYVQPTARGGRLDELPSIPEYIMAFGGGDDDWLRMQQAELEFIQRQNAERQRAAGRPDSIARTAPQPGPARHPEPHSEQGKQKGRATGVDCIACCEEIVGELRKLLCEHKYCIDCLTQMVSQSLGGESDTNFPPTCCTKSLPTDSVKAILSASDFKKYQERLADRKPLAQLFCPKPQCSAKLSANDIKAETGTCPRCLAEMCTKCKGFDHVGVCKESELAEVAKKEGWASCPACHRMIQKVKDSCNKMTCVCGVKFCYLCGKAIVGNPYASAIEGGCDCPIYNHDDHPELLQ